MAHAPRICGRQTEDGSICGGVVQPGEECPKCGGSRHKFAGGRYRSDVDRSDTAERRRLRRAVFDRAEHRCEIRYPDICLHTEQLQLDRVQREDGYSMENTCCACRPCHARKTSWEALQAQGIDAPHLQPPTIIRRPEPQSQPAPGVLRIDIGGHRDSHGQGGISDDILEQWHRST